MTRKIHPAEIIATHIGWDMAEVQDHRYHYGHTGGVAVFAMTAGYYCAPAKGRKPPKGWKWVKVATVLERDVYHATTEVE